MSGLILGQWSPKSNQTNRTNKLKERTELKQKEKQRIKNGT